ncbi:MAG: serine hydrolase [Gemmataceae bacterium]
MLPVYCRGRLLLLLTSLAFIGLPASSVAQQIVPPPNKYKQVVGRLEKWIAHEVQVKRLPSLSIVIVEDQQTVWARGFGWADLNRKKPATAETVYRVGSVSKPFTALLLMMLVEMGFVDLDEPVQRYLPSFKVRNQFDKKITLRQMLCHRSGLVRESPVGNYFDATNPTLARTVSSLNKTKLVYRPETKTAYSNAALATVGRVIEQLMQKPFAKVMDQKLLQPLGMTNSSFVPTPKTRKYLAAANMWTYHGREFPAPKFELGMIPAGGLYSNANDMAKFLRFLFAQGRGPKGRILKADTLEPMWKPQLVKPQTKSGFGIGFYVYDFEGRKMIGHSGAIYGFSTKFAALPKEKLGVVVMSSKDVSNAVTTHIGNMVLKTMIAVREGKPLPALTTTQPVPSMLARRLDGRYQAGKKTLELIETNGKLYAFPLWIGRRVEIRKSQDGLLTDGLLGHGTKVKPVGKNVRYGQTLFKRVAVAKPKPCPKKWLGLIGEYGWDYNTLYILEKDGQLYVLIEWMELTPLKEISSNVFQFPEFGMYRGDRLVFTRDKNGRATKVVAASVTFERRSIKGEDGKTWTVEPIQSLKELRKAALAATPPKEKGRFRKPDLLDVSKLDKTIKLDIRYAGRNNFLQTPFYRSAKAFLQRPAAKALVRVHKKLAKKGYGLVIFDCYRPWHVTKMFWDAVPDKFHDFVADPQKGSRHNRGCAADVGLYDLKTGKVIPVVAGYDEFSDRAYVDYLGGTELQRWHRNLLRRAMEEEGFSVYEAEWWHYDYRDWKKYPILNVPFEKIK